MAAGEQQPRLAESLGAGFQAMAFGSVVGKVQAGQLKSLREEGIEDEVAFKMAIETSVELARVLTEMVKMLLDHSGGISAVMDSIRMVMESERQPPR